MARRSTIPRSSASTSTGFIRGPKLFPAPRERMTALRRQALGDGLLDALVLWRGEIMRPAEQQSKPYLASFAARNEAALASARTGGAGRSKPARFRSAMSRSVARLPIWIFALPTGSGAMTIHGLRRWHATFARPSLGPRHRAGRRRLRSRCGRWPRPRPSPASSQTPRRAADISARSPAPRSAAPPARRAARGGCARRRSRDSPRP